MTKLNELNLPAYTINLNKLKSNWSKWQHVPIGLVARQHKKYLYSPPTEI
jgi:hypothetical protein